MSPAETKEGNVTDYELLKHAGHSPAKAAEIVLDARRGDTFAAHWLAYMRARQ